MYKFHCKMIVQVYTNKDFTFAGAVIQTHNLPTCFFLWVHYLPAKDLHLSDWPLCLISILFSVATKQHWDLDLV